MQKRKMVLFLALLLSFTILYSSIGYYQMSRPPAQPFVGLGLCTDRGCIVDSNTLNVTVGQELNWHVQIENRLGSIQLARIVFRLSNSSYASANETTSSNATDIGESDIFIPNGENGTIPFFWKVVSYTNSTGLTYITLQLNGHQVSPYAGARNGPPPGGFRFIIEVWTLDDTSGTFRYTTPNGHPGTYLTKWFNLI